MVPIGTIVLSAIVQPDGVLPVGCQFVPLAAGTLCVVLPVIVTSVASWFTRITGTPEPREFRSTILSVIVSPLVSPTAMPSVCALTIVLWSIVISS